MPKLEMDKIIEREFISGFIYKGTHYKYLFRYSSEPNSVTGRKENVLAVPENGEFDWLRCLHSISEHTILGYQNASLYRMAVVDENIPDWCSRMEVQPSFQDPFYGRTVMIETLGEIKYDEACPELCEAMLHDLSEEIRHVAAESLGKMGNKSYAPKVISALKKEKKEYPRYAVIEALGKLGDKKAIMPLRELFEQTIYEIHEADFMGKEWIEYSNQWDRLIKILTAMLRIGDPLARQSWNEAYEDYNIHICEAAKRAKFWLRLGSRKVEAPLPEKLR